METLSDLQREQIRVRCEIANLYGRLLQLANPSKKLLNAAHEWGLRHIESLVNDILFNVPQHKTPANPYTEYFLLAGVSNEDMNFLIGSLVETLHAHSVLGTKIEQVAKGVA